MASDSLSDERPPEEELAEAQEQKEEEVLEREGLEQELMQKDQSDVGTEIEGIEEADESDG